MTHEQLLDRIVADPAICHCTPCVRGHRIWVSLIVDLLADGKTVEHIPQQYPGLESDDILHTEDEFFDGVPAQIAYPSNLVIIGTVNTDETTHGLSDKVLDRAFVIEFRDVDLDAYPHWAAHDDRVRALLGDLMTALSPARLHFGWRVVDEVVAFLREAGAAGQVLSFEEAIDAVVDAKVLPKLRGEDTPRLRAALTGCASALKAHGLSRSEAKVVDLHAELLATGSTRFWR